MTTRRAPPRYGPRRLEGGLVGVPGDALAVTRQFQRLAARKGWDREFVRAAVERATLAESAARADGADRYLDVIESYFVSRGEAEFEIARAVPMSEWARHHWSTLAYMARVADECSGFQVGSDPLMRANRRNFRVLRNTCHRPVRRDAGSVFWGVVMQRWIGTRLADGKRIPDHDDWNCVQDFAAEELLDVDVEQVRPGIVLRLSERGRRLADAMATHKRDGNELHTFSPLPEHLSP